MSGRQLGQAFRCPTRDTRNVLAVRVSRMAGTTASHLDPPIMMAAPTTGHAMTNNAPDTKRTVEVRSSSVYDLPGCCLSSP